MQKRTKILCVTIAMSVVFGACADTVFTYTLADDAATITGASNIGTVLEIPESIDGYPVVAIGPRAFNFELELERLSIPNSVTNIGEYAFALCHGMAEIYIPDSVKSIGRYAFYKCYDTEVIEIGSGVKTIGKWAFGECYALEILNIAHGVEIIDEYAFGRCYSLERIVVPRSVMSIKWGAFSEIPALREACLPDSVEGSISSGAFENSPNVAIQYYQCQTPVAPMSPRSVVATDDLNGKIRVTWEIDEYAEVSSFKIYRAMRPHFRKAVLLTEVLVGDDCVYEDTDVSSDYTYCYWVVPVNDIFEGGLSQVAVGYCEDPREEVTYYVDAANGNDTNDGLSKETAVKSLQVAINRTGNCDTIIVADGVYAPIETQNRHIVIESENGYKTTVIDGGETSGCVSCLNFGLFYPDFSPDTNTVIRGFTLQNGRAIHGAGAVGGTLEYCLITGNVAYNEEPGYSATFYYGQGGGTYGSTLRHCTVVGNTAEFWPGYYDDDPSASGGEGGGTYGGVIENCIVTDNEGTISPNVFSSDFSGYNCVGDDPMFCDSAHGDYRLMPNSPCIVNGVVVAGCESEIVSAVPELTAAEVESWISEGLAVRFAKSGESAADYENRFVDKFGTDPVVAMTKVTSKKDVQGNDMYVWQDYVAGTDPTDTNSVFTANVEMVDGLPVVTWEPKLSEGEEARRNYTIYGKTNLTDRVWHSPTNEASRFFKVGVEMR